ncbi:MAG: family 10 glycosylhydrolase, partial [Abditibacteriota bacterium]|nr:family 10 glycosylhydrolase [Abditibacteriota bacterium]
MNKLLTALILALFTLTAASAQELRGIWLDANSIPKTESEITALVNKYADAGINVIFPETVARGYAAYESEVLERDPRFAGAPDTLSIIIDAAHKRGIEIHPWVWVFRAGYTQDRGAILKAHPDWVMLSKAGDDLSANGGLWITPASEPARKFLMKLYEELVTKYDIDGLHLDYLRYEVQSPMPYGYDKTAREDFMDEYGIDPVLIDRLSQNMYSWNSYRERLINTFVQELSLRLRAIKPDLLISAAVGNDPTVARVNLLQNWPHWADNGWVDFLTPMSYTANNETFRKLLAKEADAARMSRTPMAPGIGLHLFKTDAEKATEQLNIIKTFGFPGSMLFASAHLTDEMLAAIAANAYAEKPEKSLRDVIKHRRRSYVKPTPPPLGIPENVLPIPTANVPRTAAPIEVDGDDSDWSSPRYVTIAHDPEGNPASVETKVAMRYDDENLYFLFVCSDPKVSEIKRTVDKRDGPTFYEDSCEVFVDIAGNGAVYYHLSTN